MSGYHPPSYKMIFVLGVLSGFVIVGIVAGLTVIL